MKKIVFLLLLHIMILSCNQVEKPSDKVIYTSGVPEILPPQELTDELIDKHDFKPEIINYRMRVRILENGITDYVYLSKFEYDVFRVSDTIWFNTDTHRIDDTSRYTMMAVILPNEL